MVMGMQDGAVRIQPLTEEHSINSKAPYYNLSIHDNSYGNITHVTLSHDDKYLFTVGADGNFFAFSLMDETRMEEKVAEAKAKIPSARVRLSYYLMEANLVFHANGS